MTDRELLELAAKAAGLSVDFSGDVPMLLKSNDAKFPDVERWEVDRLWNPLTDDGDALRLAVRLGMEVYVDDHPNGCDCTEAQSHTHKTPDNAMRSVVNHDDDAYAATRRAIVVAAAEVGKTR